MPSDRSTPQTSPRKPASCGPHPDVVSGPDEVIRAFASILGVFEHCQLVPEEYIDRGDVIVVPTIWQGTLVGSDSVIKEHVNAVYTLRDGRICRIAYFDADRGRDGAGRPGVRCAAGGIDRFLVARRPAPATARGRR